MTPLPQPPPTRDDPFWSYEDLGLLIGSVLPIYFIALIILHALPAARPAFNALIVQSLFYALLLGVLHALVALRYARPFWSSLGWVPFRRPLLVTAAGPALALASSAFGVLLKAPPLPSPIEDLISDRRSLVIMAVFLALIGPVFEELIFRGFLFPLLARSAGPWPGIVLTAIAFALVHGAQYHWSWQHLTVVGLAGAVFGFVRYKSGSTAAATLVHTGYNATLFIAFMAQKTL
jgi:membrane protease YdiL (CAAX protease family)